MNTNKYKLTLRFSDGRVKVRRLSEFKPEDFRVLLERKDLALVEIHE